jgi:hypothetical protein
VKGPSEAVRQLVDLSDVEAAAKACEEAKRQVHEHIAKMACVNHPERKAIGFMIGRGPVCVICT